MIRPDRQESLDRSGMAKWESILHSLRHRLKQAKGPKARIRMLVASKSTPRFCPQQLVSEPVWCLPASKPTVDLQLLAAFNTAIHLGVPGGHVDLSGETR